MATEKVLNCFTAYDVRGKLGDEFNEEIAYRIGRAAAQTLNAKTVVLGFDARATSPSLARAVARGICHANADVLEIGLAGTEEMYAATMKFGADAGIEVTASHNPIDYNGIKIVKHGSKPLSTHELITIKCIAEESNFMALQQYGETTDKRADSRNSYIDKILRFVDLPSLMPLKIVINSGNGAAGPTIDALNNKMKEKGVKTNFVYVHHDPDSSFPNGIPNPLIKENQSTTAKAVLRENADFGVAFDGDFDRCFLFDNLGNFIPGEYVIGMLAEVFLCKEKGAKIVHDPRVVWNIKDVVNKFDGQPVASKTGHAFVKAAMSDSGAIYGGEMSAHHYFRDFACCDSGMIPWLIIWELLSKTKMVLSELISERKRLYPSSGEINFTVSNAANSLQQVKEIYFIGASSFDEIDGLSISFETWRFNLRKSNTEPLVRLNVETNGDHLLLREKTEELSTLLKNA